MYVDHPYQVYQATLFHKKFYSMTIYSEENKAKVEKQTDTEIKQK